VTYIVAIGLLPLLCAHPSASCAIAQAQNEVV
jgi:hypothetical protein